MSRALSRLSQTDILEKNLLGHRSSFPEPAEHPAKPNIMGTVAKLIKEGSMTKFVAAGNFPAIMNEPFSEHHRRAQMAEFFYLLDKAAEQPKESELRILYVAAFMIASWSEPRSHQMSYKPFKCLLNETFELVNPTAGYKLLAEQVSFGDGENGKNTAIWNAWGREWHAEFQMEPTIKFHFSSTGPYLNYNTNFISEIQFSDGDHYACSLPPGIVSHLTAQPQVWSFNGNAEVSNTETGMICKTDLTEPSFLSREKRHRVKGSVFSDGKKLDHIKLLGVWDQKLYVAWEGKSYKDKKDITLWEVPTGTRNRFGFNCFAEQLNYLSKELAAVLPPTDSRLREDIRFVEEGQYTKAEEAKARMNKRQASQAGASSIWFEPCDSPSSRIKYRYKGGYWEARKAKMNGIDTTWSDIPDIFGLRS